MGAAAYFSRELPGKSLVVLEGRDNIGGTWDLSRYPGIRSDADLHTFGGLVLCGRSRSRQPIPSRDRPRRRRFARDGSSRRPGITGTTRVTRRMSRTCSTSCRVRGCRRSGCTIWPTLALAAGWR
ncbi:hypothetical protein [Amycolatopsis sp. GA6-003]|uniref:hypothetical protein n=1 Tax=Amycolatopsis sp. GA6-003 TaxID=2652444 RepID=UPI003916E3F0